MYKFILVLLGALTLSACCESNINKCVELTDGSGVVGKFVEYSDRSYIIRLHKSKKLIKLNSSADFIYTESEKCGVKISSEYG